MTATTMRAQPERRRPVIPEFTFGDRLRKTRQIAELGQRQYAEILGVTGSAYAQWEADNNLPRDVVAIAKRVELYTGVPAAWLLGLDAAEAWAPWGSNPQPAGSVGAQVIPFAPRRTTQPSGYVSSQVAALRASA